MPEAKVRSLKVRPARSADLSLNMPGILAEQNASTAILGQTVARFDITSTLYRYFGETNNDGRLVYDSKRIREVMTATGRPPFLFSLRNEALGASLDQAIDRRENMYLDRVKPVQQAQNRMTDSYKVVLDRLSELAKNTQSKREILEAAYKTASGERPGDPPNWTTGVKDTTTGTTSSPMMAMVNVKYPGPTAPLIPVSEIRTTVKDPQEKNQQFHDMVPTQSVPSFLVEDKKAGFIWKFPDTDSFVSQKIITQDPQLRHPRLDNLLSGDQNLVAIHLELIRHELASFRAPNMVKMANSELHAMDQEIRILQANFAHTFLFSPISGIVTAVYKDIGESVEAGEPIMRIEDPTDLYAVGQIQYRNRLSIGQKVTIDATALFETETNSQEKAEIVSIRGHETNDDEWDVIMRFKNPDFNGGLLYPLNYGFDPDTTKILT